MERLVVNPAKPRSDEDGANERIREHEDDESARDSHATLHPPGLGMALLAETRDFGGHTASSMTQCDAVLKSYLVKIMPSMTPITITTTRLTRIFGFAVQPLGLGRNPSRRSGTVPSSSYEFYSLPNNRTD